LLGGTGFMSYTRAQASIRSSCGANGKNSASSMKARVRS